MELVIPRVDDFEVTAELGRPVWEKAPWQALTRVNGEATYGARAKVLWSEKGIYFLFDCEDRKLTCSMTEDYDDIYNEDVVEVFLWPDEAQPLYFEYEISPLGVELPIVVPNHEGTFMGWRPWHYEGERKVRRATQVRGGPKAAGASVAGWSAEFFIPFALFKGLGNVPPTPGMKWRANWYRIDYDGTAPSHWAWCPRTGNRFHRFREFGSIVFGG